MYCRCYIQTDKDYHRYGGRGITICDDWRLIPNPTRIFEITKVNRVKRNNFISWSMQNGFREGLTIDRIDNNKGYSPDNCRWTTDSEQCKNKNKSKNTTSKFRCVVWHSRDAVWQAAIRVNGHKVYLGYFNTELDAAKAYNEYVIINKLSNPLNIFTDEEVSIEYKGAIKTRGSSKYKYLTWDNQYKKWKVKIKGKFIGRFATEEIAVNERNTYMIKHHLKLPKI